MFDLKRLGKSFLYAVKGFIKTFREEQNLKIQTMVAVLIVFLGYFYQISKTEWLFLVFVIGLVMLMELANSAVERIADVLKPRINNYIKEIKDIMAAAVLLASVVSVIIGLIIFIPYIFG